MAAPVASRPETLMIVHFSIAPAMRGRAAAVHRSAIGFNLILSAAAVFFATSVRAQEKATKDGIDYNNPFIYDRADSPLQDLLSKGKVREALRLLKKMLKSTELTPKERADLLRFKAQLDVQLGNFKEAIKDIEAAIESGALTDIEKQENYYFLGRLYLGIEPPNYAKSIEYLRKFIAAADHPDPDAWFYLGQALAMTGKFREAIPQAKKAIALSKEPKENYYRLLLFCYSKLKDYEQVASLAERMLMMFAVKDEYLSQLAAGYQALGRDKDAFRVQAMRYELGFLNSEEELVGIADLFLIYENPHRAARILEKEMKAGRVRRTKKNLEKLGNMWFLAREYDKALTYLREAAGKSNRGMFDFHIGQMLFEREDWSRAELHFRRALKKGGLKEPCGVHMLLAHALHNQGRDGDAREEFQRAARAGSQACTDEARRWAEYFNPYIDGPKTEAFGFMTRVLNALRKSAVAAADDDNVRALAGEVLEAAEAALNADSERTRKGKLSEYERGRELAMRHLNAGALGDARDDRVVAERLIAEAAKKDLTPDEIKMVHRLDESTRDRIEALEAARVDLEKAAKFAAEARARKE